MKYIMAAAAFALGTGISYLNFLILKEFIKKGDKFITVSTVIRQIVSIGYLLALYVIGEYTDFGQWYLLIGGALGVTLPNFIFTSRLIGGKSDGNNDVKENGDGREI